MDGFASRQGWQGIEHVTENKQNAGNRMGNLLDDIFNNIAGTMVILSTLLPSLDPALKDCHDSVNSQLRDQVTSRSAQGQKIVLAEMEASDPSYWNLALGGDYFDSTHPNDAGHAKMAAIWYITIFNVLLPLCGLPNITFIVSNLMLVV